MQLVDIMAKSKGSTTSNANTQWSEHNNMTTDAEGRFDTTLTHPELKRKDILNHCLAPITGPDLDCKWSE